MAPSLFLRETILERKSVEFHAIHANIYMDRSHEEADKEMICLRTQLLNENKFLLVILDETTESPGQDDYWDAFQHTMHSQAMLLLADKIVIRKGNEERIWKDLRSKPAKHSRNDRNG